MQLATSYQLLHCDVLFQDTDLPLQFHFSFDLSSSSFLKSPMLTSASAEQPENRFALSSVNLIFKAKLK